MTFYRDPRFYGAFVVVFALALAAAALGNAPFPLLAILCVTIVGSGVGLALTKNNHFDEDEQQDWYDRETIRRDRPSNDDIADDTRARFDSRWAGIETDAVPPVTEDYSERSRGARVYSLPLAFFFSNGFVGWPQLILALLLVALVIALISIYMTIIRPSQELRRRSERRSERPGPHSPYRYATFVGDTKIEEGFIGGRRGDTPSAGTPGLNTDRIDNPLRDNR